MIEAKVIPTLEQLTTLGDAASYLYFVLNEAPIDG